MILSGPAELYAAPLPRCPVHGQMTYVPAMCRYECRGWDGEGCGTVVTDEEMVRGMMHIGQADGLVFTASWWRGA